MVTRRADRRTWLAGLALASLLGAAPAVRAEDPSPPPTLDLSIRARALGIVPEPAAAGSLGLETVRAPTGAGRSRMPQARTGAERTPGLYVGAVVCEPGGPVYYEVRVDPDTSLPEGQLRSGAPGPRGLYLPGRPIP
jgi:hypothetical protein